MKKLLQTLGTIAVSSTPLVAVSCIKAGGSEDLSDWPVYEYESGKLIITNFKTPTEDIENFYEGVAGHILSDFYDFKDATEITIKIVEDSAGEEHPTVTLDVNTFETDEGIGGFATIEEYLNAEWTSTVELSATARSIEKLVEEAKLATAKIITDPDIVKENLRNITVTSQLTKEEGFALIDEVTEYSVIETYWRLNAIESQLVYTFGDYWVFQKATTQFNSVDGIKIYFYNIDDPEIIQREELTVKWKEAV